MQVEGQARDFVFSALSYCPRQGHRLRSEQGRLEHAELRSDTVKAIPDVLPAVFQLNPDVALPESVPIKYLSDSRTATEKYTNRPDRLDAAFVNECAQKRSWFDSSETVTKNAGSISDLLSLWETELPRAPKQTLTGCSWLMIWFARLRASMRTL